MLNVLAYYVLFVLSFFTCAKAEKIRKNIERLLERMEKAKEKTNYEHHYCPVKVDKWFFEIIEI